MNRVLQLLVLVVAIASAIYPADPTSLIYYAVAAIFSLIFTDYGHRTLEKGEEFSWRSAWIGALAFGIAPWILGGLMATMTGVPFNSLVLFLFGVPVGGGFCLGVLLSWAFRRAYATTFNVVALGAALVFVVAVFIVKTPYERQREVRTPITLSAQIDGNHDLHDLQAIVNGKTVSCMPLKDRISCSEGANSK